MTFMDMNKEFRNELHKLDVYRCALQLYRTIRVILNEFPPKEADLRSQMKRASRNVAFNIGEGVGKRGKARAAAEHVHKAQALLDRIAAMLTKLIRVTDPSRA